MQKYAFLNTAGVCDGEGVYSPALTPQPANAILLEPDESRLGQKWTGKKWVAVAPQADQRPAIVVENITADPESNGHTIVADNFAEVRTVVGAVLAITVRMEVGGQLYPANEAFDMPITSADGRVYPKRVLFEAGRATFTITMTEPRIWIVTAEMINSGLPPEKHMRFAGLRVVAAEI
jgi:hypothetical protein